MSGGGMDNESDKLHAVMAQATEGISGIRVDTSRMLRARRKRRWQETGAVVGMVAVVLAVGGFTLRHSGSDGGSAPGPGTGPTSTAVHTPTAAPTVPSFPTTPAPAATPVAVEAYDADDGTEGKDALNAFLTGRGPWKTREYCQSHPTLEGRVKPGTGLVFDLGKPTPLKGIGFDGVWGGVIEIWAADPSVTAMPPVVPFAPPTGFHKVGTMDQSENKYPKFSTTTRFVLIWYTELPATNTHTAAITCAAGSPRYQGEIDAIYF
jgi:hypothetical protein